MKIRNSKLFGASVLLVSGLICKALGALFRLPLTNLLGIEGIGIFQLITSLYSFALVVTSGGVANSLSKLIGTARAQGVFEKISIYLKRALFISVGVGLFLGIVFAVFGNFISEMQGIASGGTYKLFILLLPLGAGLSAFRGFFQGYENMLPTAISQIIEQVFKFVFGLLFTSLFCKYGLVEGVLGAFLGIVISEVITFLYLIILWFVKNKKGKQIDDLKVIRFARREYDRANIPLTLSASILPLVNAIDALFVVSRLVSAGLSSGIATKLFGLQSGVVGALLNFPLIISMSVTTSLLPNVSYLVSRGAGSHKVIEKGLCVLLYLVLPATFGLVAISRQVLSVVYVGMNGQILDIAFELMFYGAFSIIFTALMQYLVMLLQANGQFKFILTTTIFGGVIKVVVSLALSAVRAVNIFALVFGNICFSAFVCVFALYKLKGMSRFRISLKEILSILFGTFSMFIVVYAFINCNYFSVLVNVVLSIMLGVLTYFVFTIPVFMKIRPSLKKIKKVV